MSILERLGRERPKMNVVYAAVELLDQDIDIQNFYMEYCSTLKNERNPGKAVISNLKHALNELESPNEDLWKKNVPCTPWMKYWN